MLFDRNKSALIVIDLQDYFIAKLPLPMCEPLVERIVWLVHVAHALDIPVFATAEDVARNGGIVEPLAKVLPSGTKIFDKQTFNLADQKDIMSAVKASGRTEFILTGMETDICVAQSALGLLSKKMHVAVTEDATASPPPHHDAGLRRLRDAGASIMTAKAIYYDWLRDLDTLHAVKDKIAGKVPKGLLL
jgi:nicotinamidase-related amidase